MIIKKKKFSMMKIALILMICTLMSVRIPVLMYIAQALLLISVCLHIHNYGIRKEQSIYIFISIIFMTFCGISVLWSADLSYYMESMVSIVQIYIISIAIFVVINTNERFEFVTDAFVTAGWAILAYIAISTPISSWKDMMAINLNLSSSKGRLGPTIGMHANYCGCVLSILLLFSVYKWTVCQKKVYIIQMLLLFLCLMFTKSRTSLMISVIGVFLFIAINKKLSLKQIFRIGVSIVVMIGLLFFSLKIEFLYSLYGNRIESLLNYANARGATDASVTGRMLLIQKAKEVFFDHPIIGVGIGNFAVYNDAGGGITGYYAHNNFLELLADIGVIGFTMYYIPFFICILRLYSCLKNGRQQDRVINSLLFTLLLMRIIADYAQVSYLYDSSQLILAMAFASVKISNDNKKIQLNESK